MASVSFFVYLAIIGKCWHLVVVEEPQKPLYDNRAGDIIGSETQETRGFMKKDNSLVKPYGGLDTNMRNWEITGNALITSNYVRLTSDKSFHRGAIWSQVPVRVYDWELEICYNIQPTNIEFKGNGITILYVSKDKLADISFGNSDITNSALSVVVNTRKTELEHRLPYLTAVVHRGSTGNESEQNGQLVQKKCLIRYLKGVLPKQILIRYVANTLTIFVDIFSMGVWEQCLSVKNVVLPLDYYFGISASTGEVGDIHDILSIKFYEQEMIRESQNFSYQASNSIPRRQSLSMVPTSRKMTPLMKAFLLSGIILLLIATLFAGATDKCDRRLFRRKKRFY